MKRGFTLVEMIVSLSLFCLLIGSVYLALGSELKAWHRLSQQTADYQAAGAVLNQLQDDIKKASQILPTSDTKNLSLLVNGRQIEYSLKDKKVRRQNNGYTTYLTDVGEVTNLSFAYPGSKLVEVMVGKLTTSASLRN